MNHRKKIKLYAIGTMSIFFSLTFFSTFAAANQTSNVFTPPRVRIPWSDVSADSFFYEINYVVQNYENYEVFVDIDNVMIHPDGSIMEMYWEKLPLQAHGILAPNIFGAYHNTDPYGKYSWVITLKDHNSGAILDTVYLIWYRQVPNDLYI